MPQTAKALTGQGPLQAMAIGYPQRDEAEGVPECEACGSLELVLDALGKPIRCKGCGAVMRDPFAAP